MRLITVLAMIFGLFLFVVVAIILSFALDPMPESELYGEKTPSSGELLAADKELATGERRLREMERYVTSDTFATQSFSPAITES